MKLVKIDSCKNIFFCLVLLLVTFFNVILLFSNAYGEQINESKALIEVFPITSHGAVLKNDSNSSTSNLLSSSRNYTSNEVNNTKLLPPPPPIISYIENEGAPLN